MGRFSLNINGNIISYFDINPQKSERTLIFVHGNSMSASLFKKVLVHKIFSNYRVIAFDLPGHGESDRSSAPLINYRFNALKAFICSFVNQLKLTDIVLIGHSLGGHISIQIIPELQKQVRGLVISGTPPLRTLADGTDAFLPSVAMQYAYTGDLRDNEVRIFASAFGNGKNLEEIVESVYKTDILFRPVLGASLAEDSFENEQVIISKFNQKILLMHGEEDKLINQEYLENIDKECLDKHQIQIVRDSGHMNFMDNPEEFVRIIYSYLLDIGF